MSTEPIAEAKHILWHDEEHEVFVVDGPQSILDAQGAELRDKGYKIVSTPSRSAPYPSQEPKSKAARERLLQANASDQIHEVYAALLERALARVSIYSGPWLLPRQVLDKDGQHVDSGEQQLAKLFENESTTATIECGTYLSNADDNMTLLRPSNDDRSYLLPTQSTFMLADCLSSQDITTFHDKLRSQALDHDTIRKFDLIILDPPWDNRSVKRKRSAYETADKYGIATMLSRMDLDRTMSVGCVVAVWITNKASAREVILGDGGFFECCGISLIEEWLWIKVTDQGQPLSDVRGLWRKPYEVLLIGKRQAIGVTQPQVQIKRRWLVGVPDLHSRKPCLKALLETTLLHTQNYRALEVFARHLVAGWWSWGNECLKFNDTAQWVRSDA